VVGTGGAAATAVNQSTTVKHTGYAWFQNPIAAELVTIVADVLLADGAQIIAAQPDYPRKLQIRVTDGDSSISAGTVTVVGVGAGGEALSEVHNLTGGTQTIDTTNAFATVTSATVASLAGNAAGDNIGIGVGSCLGLPIPGTATGLVVHKTVVDDADEAVAGVDAAANAVDPTTSPNATHDYGFFYSFDMAHTATQNAHSHTGAEGEGTFVAAATSLPYGAYTPSTTPNGAHDYAVIYERDVS